MFSGSWKESNLKEIIMDIPDSTIDIAGKNIFMDKFSLHYEATPIL